MTSEMLTIIGAPASPYTRKMLAVLRHRRIPYKFLINQSKHNLPKPKVGLIPIVYFRNSKGQLEPAIDSTPIIRKLEVEYAGRSIIPKDPATAFLNYLLEDYGDEWLTKAMFHYRWAYPKDADMAGSILPFYQGGIAQSNQKIVALKKAFSERQISRLGVVGSNETTKEVIEGSFLKFLTCLDNLLQSCPFLLGAGPRSCDFAFFGQLTQLAQFDPTPSDIIIKRFPRVHAWVSTIEDLSGLEVSDSSDLEIQALGARLSDLLGEVGQTYAPVMLRNEEAINSGKTKFETLVRDKPWRQEVFPYQSKCLHWLRIEFSKLEPTDKQKIYEIFDGTGCELLIDKPHKE